MNDQRQGLDFTGKAIALLSPRPKLSFKIAEILGKCAQSTL